MGFSFAQDVNYFTREYTTDDGLPSMEVYCVEEDHEGYMWFGTDGGVSRFDGYSFQNFSVNNGLPENTIFRLYEDDEGRMWCMTFTKGLCYFKNDSVFTYKHNSTLLNNFPVSYYIMDMKIDEDKTIYFRTFPGGGGKITDSGEISYEFKSNNDYHEIIIENDSLPVPYLLFSKENREQKVKITGWGNNELEFEMEGNLYGRMRSFSTNEGYILIVGMFKYTYIIELNKNGVQMREVDTHEYIDGCFTDKIGQFWLCSHDRGAMVYRDKECFFYGEEPITHIYDGTNISEVYVDKTGGMWVTNENNGVFYLVNQAVKKLLFSC